MPTFVEQGGDEQGQDHRRLDKHAYQQLTKAANAGIGVGRVESRQREEEASQRHQVKDDDDVAQNGNRRPGREHRDAHGQHQHDAQVHSRRDAMDEAGVGRVNVLTLEQLRDVVVVLEDAGAFTRMHLRADDTRHTRYQRRKSHDYKSLNNSDHKAHRAPPPI